MNTNDIAKYYGSAAQAQFELKVSRQLWNYWKKKGVPLERQLEIQMATSSTGAPLLLGKRK